MNDPNIQLDSHVEIDIETLSLKPGGVVLSIGAVRFNPRLGRIQTYEEFVQAGKTLKVVLDIGDSIDKGFTVDPETQDWWNNQSKEAHDATFNSGQEAPVIDCMTALYRFIQKGDTVWGNGANFDPGMLEAYFDKLGMECPWKFYKVKCYRTIKDLLDYNQFLVPPNKIKHDCLADAVYQAQVTQAIYLANPQIKPERKDR